MSDDFRGASGNPQNIYPTDSNDSEQLECFFGYSQVKPSHPQDASLSF